MTSQPSLWVHSIRKELVSDPQSTCVPLFTPMTLCPPVAIRIRSPMPYSISTPASPSTLSMISGDGINLITSTTTINLQPLSPLGPIFVQRWNSLPDELNIEILFHNLKAARMVHNRTASTDRGYRVEMTNRLLPRLRMTPEVATLAREVFYRINTFHIEPAYRSVKSDIFPTSPHVRPCFAYLAASINHLVRKLSIGVKLRHREWNFVRKFANGDYGFPNLQKLRLLIDWQSPCFIGSSPCCTWQGFWDEVLEQKLILPYTGTIRFEKIDEERLTRYGVDVQSFQKQLRAKVTFDAEVERGEHLMAN